MKPLGIFNPARDADCGASLDISIDASTIVIGCPLNKASADVDGSVHFLIRDKKSGNFIISEDLKKLGNANDQQLGKYISIAGNRKYITIADKDGPIGIYEVGTEEQNGEKVQTLLSKQTDPSEGGKMMDFSKDGTILVIGGDTASNTVNNAFLDILELKVENNQQNQQSVQWNSINRVELGLGKVVSVSTSDAGDVFAYSTSITSNLNTQQEETTATVRLVKKPKSGDFNYQTFNDNPYILDKPDSMVRVKVSGDGKILAVFKKEAGNTTPDVQFYAIINGVDPIGTYIVQGENNNDCVDGSIDLTYDGGRAAIGCQTHTEVIQHKYSVNKDGTEHHEWKRYAYLKHQTSMANWKKGNAVISTLGQMVASYTGSGVEIFEVEGAIYQSSGGGGKGKGATSPSPPGKGKGKGKGDCKGKSKKSNKSSKKGSNKESKGSKKDSKSCEEEEDEEEEEEGKKDTAKAEVSGLLNDIDQSNNQAGKIILPLLVLSLVIGTAFYVIHKRRQNQRHYPESISAGGTIDEEEYHMTQEHHMTQEEYWDKMVAFGAELKE